MSDDVIMDVSMRWGDLRSYYTHETLTVDFPSGWEQCFCVWQQLICQGVDPVDIVTMNHRHITWIQPEEF